MCKDAHGSVCVRTKGREILNVQKGELAMSSQWDLGGHLEEQGDFGHPDTGQPLNTFSGKKKKNPTVENVYGCLHLSKNSNQYMCMWSMEIKEGAGHGEIVGSGRRVKGQWFTVHLLQCSKF